MNLRSQSMNQIKFLFANFYSQELSIIPNNLPKQTVPWSCD